MTSTSVFSWADRRKIISQKRSAPTPPRVVASTTNDADVASPLSTATGMSPGILPMNDAALLRNLSKSNAYDVAQQHSDDGCLATVVEDAINDDDESNTPLPLLSKTQSTTMTTGRGSALLSHLQQLYLPAISLNSTSIG